MIFKIPKNYKSIIADPIKNEEAIEFVRDTFIKLFRKEFNLIRTSCPIMVNSNDCINDDLNGQSNPIKFNIPAENFNAEIVQSLAKWKRLKLHQLNVPINQGIYTNMNAIRTHEQLDNIHSIYVDQWDWEAVISPEDRTLDNLYSYVQRIYKCIKETEIKLSKKFKAIKPFLPNEIKCFTSSELKALYDNKSQKDIEYLITKEHKAVFISQLGAEYNRASDYDDWKLNGDILIWSDVLNQPIEISSMGIRVDHVSLINQLNESYECYKASFPYHESIIKKKLPLTIGGGIGQSRLCMILLQKAHIGEVQCSVWDQDTLEIANKNNIMLL